VADRRETVRLLTYSDLHLEFGSAWTMPSDAAGDVLILAGDIVTFRHLHLLHNFLARWTKPALYIAGNHEYYTQRPMDQEHANFQTWLRDSHPNVRFLLDQEIHLDGVTFFGGTMWTNFNGSNRRAMDTARHEMSDFRLIRNADQTTFLPQDSVVLHNAFAARLEEWLAKDLSGPRVVITHHAPVVNPRTKYAGSALMPAFNSLDMLPVIERGGIDLWIYGHTHECDDQIMGRTRIISNQLGYPDRHAGFECKDFDPHGLPIDI
jgi:predicted phosphodiesterase